MPRKPRVEYAGAIYHVMCRGNGGDDIFRADNDRELFIDTLDEGVVAAVGGFTPFRGGQPETL